MGLELGWCVGVKVALAKVGPLLGNEVGLLLGEAIGREVGRAVGKAAAGEDVGQSFATLISTSAQFQN